MKVKSITVFIILLAVLLAGGVQSAEKDDFWTNLQNKLQKVTPAKKTATTTAVGGVRAAKNEPKGDLYWKGKEKSQAIAEEELQKFNLAVDTKVKGDNEKALKLFEEFLALYPQSSLRVEGLQAMEKIKKEMAAKTPAKSSGKAVKSAPVKPAEAK